MSAPEDEPQNETQDEKPKIEETSDEKSKTEEGPAKKGREVRLPNMFWALVPILCMTALMIYVFGWVADSETYDAAHLPLLCSIVVACIVGIAYGRSFKYMLEGIIERLLVSMEAILILLLVGLLISSFMISGTSAYLLRPCAAHAANVPAHWLHHLRRRRLGVRLVVDGHGHRRHRIHDHRCRPWR